MRTPFNLFGKLFSKISLLLFVVLFCLLIGTGSFADEPDAGVDLSIKWADRFLTISGNFPGEEMRIHYLEAYCRPGSTAQEWKDTVIPHVAKLVSASDDGKRIEIEDTLRDGVIVRHTIIAEGDAVSFLVEAHNPTEATSEAHWAQPCIRIDKFTGCDPKEAREIQPSYIRKCFIYVDGKATRLPTKPWADKARYVYGQVYGGPKAPRADLNPRPISEITPSSGLTGAFSEKEDYIFGVAWEPYQEIFQGVITCMHSDFRIGGLKPGEKKTIRGKIYIVKDSLENLKARHDKDFK